MRLSYAVFSLIKKNLSTFVLLVVFAFGCSLFFLLMILRPPRSTRTDTLFPYTSLFRSWRQIDGPVLAKSVANSVYAPGHNCFFTSPDGRETWIVYHANPAAGMKCTGKRSPRIQRIDWSAKGWPIFPEPAAAGAPLAAPARQGTADRRAHV